MPRVKFPYELRKVQGTVLAQGGYTVALQLRASDGRTQILGEERVERFFHRGELRSILKTEHLFSSDAGYESHVSPDLKAPYSPTTSG